ncbi:protein accelerated cell death 6 [Quercus suber]|uniref:Protein accelerated cell death 6 n=1 Tax=Quercus suber TaxID=58331 RepID=A0AAW0LJD9_QUESU
MDTKLFNAAISGSGIGSIDSNILGQLTARGGSILHVAAKSGKVDLHIMEKVLDSKPSLLYMTNRKGNTALHIAASLGHVELTRFLIARAKVKHDQDVEVNMELLRMENHEKNTALQEAIRNDHCEIVESLIREDPWLTLFTNSAGESPLFLAVDRGFYNIARCILKAVPDCCYGGRNNMNALHAAVIRAQSIFVGELLETQICPSAILEADDFGWIPLHYAAYMGSVQVVELFLENNNSTAFVKDREGMCAIHIAAKEGHIDVLRVIILKCPDTCELLDNRDRTALHLAVEIGRRNVVKLFLQELAFRDLIYEHDNEGNTAFHLAAIKGHYALLMMLADDRRVDRMAINTAGMTTIDIDIIISKLNRDDFLLSLEQMVDRQTISEPAAVLRNAGLELDRTKVKQTAEEAVYSRLDVQNIANINLLVATIIATVTFSAAIQVPGGYDSEGVAILSKEEDFRTFMIYDSMAFGFSVLSMFIHFLAAFFTKFTSIAYPIMCVFMLTVLSLLSMFLAFVQGTQAVNG